MCNCDSSCMARNKSRSVGRIGIGNATPDFTVGCFSRWIGSTSVQVEKKSIDDGTQVGTANDVWSDRSFYGSQTARSQPNHNCERPASQRLVYSYSYYTAALINPAWTTIVVHLGLWHYGVGRLGTFRCAYISVTDGTQRCKICGANVCDTRHTSGNNQDNALFRWGQCSQPTTLAPTFYWF